MSMLKAIEQKSIIDFQQDEQDSKCEEECENCGGEVKTVIVARDEEIDEVYYGSKCKDCGVLNE